MFESLAAKLIAGAVALGIAFAGGCAVTYKIEQGVIQKNRADALAAIDASWKAGWAKRDAQEKQTDKANHGNGQVQTKIVTNTQEIIRYVPKYITVQDDAACKLPDGFGRLLDAAQLGVSADQLPAGTGQPGSAASTLTLSQATGLLTQILGDYASLRARIVNAHEDWQAQAALATQKTEVLPK